MEEKQTSPIEGYTRYQTVWNLLRPIARLISWLKFGYRCDISSEEGPFLLVSNHNTNWDPIFVGCSFKKCIYFVSSEHIVRAGLAGKLIRYFLNPITRQKSGSAADTVMAMMRRLRRGYSVCVFPEGNRSWDGVTRDFLPSIAKLARSSGVPLLTYRMEGGYFASPRWSGNSSRRGFFHGGVVRRYSAEELRSMRPDEINEHIKEDLYEDAYARQRVKPVRYRGRNSAEHLETLLFLCPHCHRFHTLRSHHDTVSCWKCGFSFRYLPTGFLAGDNIPFDNLRDWYRWQCDEVRRFCDEAGDRPIFTDSDMRTEEVTSARGVTVLARGDLRLYRDRLELPGVTIPLEKLTGVSMMGPQNIYFTFDGHHYQVKSAFTRCTEKYVTACSYLTGIQYGV